MMCCGAPPHLNGALLLAALLTTVALAACETVVDVPPPEHEPTLVAQGFFSADSLWVVRVSRSVRFTASGPPQLVDSATVKIMSGNQVVARPTRSDTGTYAATGRGAVEGQPYRLTVDAPGFPAIEGHDILPSPPPIASVQTTSVEPEDTTSRRQITRIDVTLDDPPGTDEFYGILVLQARVRVNRQTGQVTPLPPSLFPFRSDDQALGESPLDALNTESTRYREAFFPDDPFDGTKRTLTFTIQYDAPRSGATVVIRRGFAVALLSVSEDFYRYWETANEQAIVNNNPFAEPLRVHSNLDGGLGVFAGFQYQLLPVGIDSLGAGGLRLTDLCRFLGSRLPLCSGSSSG